MLLWQQHFFLLTSLALALLTFDIDNQGVLLQKEVVMARNSTFFCLLHYYLVPLLIILEISLVVDPSVRASVRLAVGSLELFSKIFKRYIELIMGRREKTTQTPTSLASARSIH
jgi:hypothetical protein